MEKIQKFDLKSVDVADIIYAKTSPEDYEMDRVYIIEEYGGFIYLEGGHCSCYGFDDTEWEAIRYTRDEMEKLAKHKDEEWKIFMKGYLGI